MGKPRPTIEELEKKLEKAVKALVHIRDDSGRTVAVSPEQIARWCLDEIGGERCDVETSSS